MPMITALTSCFCAMDLEKNSKIILKKMYPGTTLPVFNVPVFPVRRYLLAPVHVCTVHEYYVYVPLTVALQCWVLLYLLPL